MTCPWHGDEPGMLYDWEAGRYVPCPLCTDPPESPPADGALVFDDIMEKTDAKQN